LGNKVEKTKEKKRKGGRRLQKAMKLSLGLSPKYVLIVFYFAFPSSSISCTNPNKTQNVLF
jgi:hypothetical protein